MTHQSIVNNNHHRHKNSEYYCWVHRKFCLQAFSWRILKWQNSKYPFLIVNFLSKKWILRINFFEILRRNYDDFLHSKDEWIWTRFWVFKEKNSKKEKKKWPFSKIHIFFFVKKLKTFKNGWIWTLNRFWGFWKKNTQKKKKLKSKLKSLVVFKKFTIFLSRFFVKKFKFLNFLL